jgi:hypothetical protein
MRKRAKTSFLLATGLRAYRLPIAPRKTYLATTCWFFRAFDGDPRRKEGWQSHASTPCGPEPPFSRYAMRNRRQAGPMRAVDRGRRSQPAVAGGLAPPAGLNHELSTGAVAGRGATIDEVRRSRSTRGQPILWVSCVACVVPRGSSVTAHTPSGLVGYAFSHELVYFMWPFVALSSVSSAGPLDKWRRRF